MSTGASWLGVSGTTLYGWAIDSKTRQSVLYGLDAKGNQVVDVAVGPDRPQQILGLSGGTAVIGVTTRGGAAVVAVDLAAKQVRWKHEVPGATAKAVADGQRCYLQENTTTVAVDLLTGKTIWSTPGTSFDSYMTLALSGKVLTVTGVKVFALDTDGGKKLWTAVNESKYLTGPVVTENRVFVAGELNTVFAVDTTTGKEVWHLPSPLSLGSPPSGSGSVLALPISVTESRGVLAVRATDGKVLWAYRDPQPRTQQLQWTTLVHGTTVYGASGTTLYAFPSGA